MSKVISIVGAGVIAKEHVRSAQALGVPVKYVCDVDAERAQELAGSCGAKATTDFAVISSDEEVDGVVVAVPNSFHKPYAMQVLESGKDLLLEKPMGLNVAECEAINALAADKQRIVQVGLVNRYSAVSRKVKELVDAGRLGTIYHAKAMLYRRRGIPGLGGWFTTKAVSGGGALIDIGVHAIDLAMHMIDFPQPKHILGKVYNQFGKRMKGYVYEDMWAGPPNYDGVCDVDDSAHALIVFDNDASLDLNITWAGNFPQSELPESMMGFFGDKGGVTFSLFGNTLTIAEEVDGANVDQVLYLKTNDALIEQMRSFVAAISSREVEGATGLQATEVQRVIDAIYASSES